jgi:hypothetical protein
MNSVTQPQTRSLGAGRAGAAAFEDSVHGESNRPVVAGDNRLAIRHNSVASACRSADRTIRSTRPVVGGSIRSTRQRISSWRCGARGVQLTGQAGVATVTMLDRHTVPSQSSQVMTTSRPGPVWVKICSALRANSPFDSTLWDWTR